MRPDTVEVTEGTLHEWPLPEPGSDKDARGEVLVVGGGARTPGGVLLAGEACLRVGGERNSCHSYLIRSSVEIHVLQKAYRDQRAYHRRSAVTEQRQWNSRHRH